MKVAVIGHGDVSVVHLAAIREVGAELVGVATHDYRELLDTARPDVVHICTPHDQHVPIALDALDRGIHVLLEKPVAHTIAEAERLVAAAATRPDVKVGVCLQNRYNATSRAAHHLLHSPAASPPDTALSHSRRVAAPFHANTPVSAGDSAPSPSGTAPIPGGAADTPGGTAPIPGGAADTPGGTAPIPGGTAPSSGGSTFLGGASEALERGVPWAVTGVSGTAGTAPPGGGATLPGGAGAGLEVGVLGAVTGVSGTVLWHRDAAYYGARPWRGRKERSGGGVLINQAIHTLDLMQWLGGDVVRVRGHAGRFGGLPGDVEDTAAMVLDHAGGARGVFFATVAHAVDSPVTLEITAERGSLRICGDLTVTHADGRVETVAGSRPDGTGRSYWGASHELLIADFYRSLAEPEPFWIGPAEALKAQRLIDEVYRRQEGQ